MLYSPAHFEVAQRAAALDLIRRHPLATLVSDHDGEPFVSHVPLIALEGGERLQLLGHVARANPHWNHWSDGVDLLAIFHGADAYVSPSLYQARAAVPTWNYMVVHASGPVTLHHDSEAKERVLKALIDLHDPAYRVHWDELDPDWREGMKRGIVAFDVAVERLVAKFKLSQNRPAADRSSVLAAMARDGDAGSELSQWMRRLGIGT